MISYVMAKLTLHVPENLVTAAKSEAAARQVSVSKLVSDYFSFLATPAQNTRPSSQGFAPRTSRLAGCIPQTDSDIGDYIDYLERKHS